MKPFDWTFWFPLIGMLVGAAMVLVAFINGETCITSECRAELARAAQG